MDAEKQLERIAKIFGYDHVWEDQRPEVRGDGLWFAQKDNGDGTITAWPLEALIQERITTNE